MERSSCGLIWSLCQDLPAETYKKCQKTISIASLLAQIWIWHVPNMKQYYPLHQNVWYYNDDSLKHSYTHLDVFIGLYFSVILH